MTKEIAVLGHLGAGNFGDEIMLRCLLDIIDSKEQSSRVYVLVKSRDQSPQCRLSNSRVRLVELSPRSLVRVLYRTKVAIKCGGTSFHDYERPIKFYLVMLRWLAVFVLAKCLGNRVLYVGISPGPLETPLGILLARALLRLADQITFRTESSYLLSKRILDSEKYARTADLSMVLLDGLTEAERPLDGCLGVSVLPFFKMYKRRGEKDFTIAHLIGGSINDLSEKRDLESVKIFAFNKNKDYDMAVELHKTISCRSEVIAFEQQTGAFLEALRDCSIFIGFRLHSSILAYIVKAKLLMIDYHPKCADFAEEISLPDTFLIGVNELARPVLADRLRELYDMDSINYCDRDLEFSRLKEGNRDLLSNVCA